MYQSSLTIVAKENVYSMLYSWHKDFSNKFYAANTGNVDEQKLFEKSSHSSGKDMKEI